MGGITYLLAGHLEGMLGTVSKLSQMVTVGAGVVAGFVLYLALTYLFRLEELRLALDIIGRRLNFARGVRALR